MRPHFEEIQAHYDLSDDFFGTFQDPSRTYSCAFFERDDMSLEEAQMAKIDLALEELDTDRSLRVFLRGWEEFDEPVDRIISIEAFEAFPKDRYAAFFETCYRSLPTGGRMVLQTILGHPLKRWPDMGIPITMTDLKFMRFIAKEIFPGGAIPCDEDIAKFSGAAGFSLEQTQYLNEHYVRTLDT